MPVHDPMSTRIEERREARLAYLEQRVTELEREKKFAVEQIDHLCETIAEQEEKLDEYQAGMRYILGLNRDQADVIRRLKRHVYTEAA